MLIRRKKDHLARWIWCVGPTLKGGLVVGRIVSKSIALMRKWLWSFLLIPFGIESLGASMGCIGMGGMLSVQQVLPLLA